MCSRSEATPCSIPDESVKFKFKLFILAPHCVTGLRTEAFFYGCEAELNLLAKHIGVNILLIDDTLPRGAWRWTFPRYPEPANQPHTAIFRLRYVGNTDIKHYDVVSFKGLLVFDTHELPAALKTLHCIA